MIAPILSTSSPTICKYRTGAGALRNLVDHSEDASTWATTTLDVERLDLGALGRFPGFALRSLVNTSDRARFGDFDAIQGEAVWLSLWIRAGSSNAIRLLMRDYVGAVSYVYTGALDALPAGGSWIELVSRDVLADGVSQRLVFRLLPGFDGEARMSIGPASPTPGEDIIVLAAQVERGTAATAYQARGT